MAKVINENIVRDFVKALKAERKKPSAYDTTAKVLRVDGDTAWVHIAGGVDETPVKLTVNAEKGDEVQVRVAGGKAWIVGNATAPPTDDKTANIAHKRAVNADTKAIAAKQTAEEADGKATDAKEIAVEAGEAVERVTQHFWTDEDGAHITQVSQEDWNDPNSQYYHAKGNTLITSEGMAVRDGMTELSTFGSDGITIGQIGQSRVFIDYHSMQLIDREGTTYFHVSDLRDKLGYLTDKYFGDGETKTFYLMGQPNNYQDPIYKVTIDDVKTTEYTFSFSANTVTFTTAPADGAEIKIKYIPHPNTKAYTFGVRATLLLNENMGLYSVVEGDRNEASGYASHAEGEITNASGRASHAEGYNTRAKGSYSHAEGENTEAHNTAHAEGERTKALGPESHAQNEGTTAQKRAQTTLGTYNVIDSSSSTVHPSNINQYGKYSVIVGNGVDSNNRSNALTVDWNGNVEAAGDIEDGSGNVLSNKIEESDVKPLFTITNPSFSYSAISSGSGTGAKTVTSSNPGYYPLGVVGFRSGASAAVPTRFNLTKQESGNAEMTYVLRAVANVSAGSGDAHILWVKE